MIYLVSGGADSGKSYLSEKIMMQYNKKLYLATMENKSQQAKKRIEKHRLQRKGKGFETFEKERGFQNIDFSKYDAVLLECLATLTANHLYTGGSRQTLFSDITYLMETCKNIVFVTNDISSCGISYNDEMYKYMKILNYAACSIAEKADVVVETVCGIPLVHKGRL